MIPKGWFRGPWWLYAIALFLLLLGAWWGLPNSESWAADSISPRSSGLFAVVLPYLPGRFHTYPPLHMIILTLLSLPVTLVSFAACGFRPSQLESTLLSPWAMTSIEVISRAVSILLAVGIVDSVYRFWSKVETPRAGVVAGLAVTWVMPWAYYGKVGNVDIASVFWVVLAFEQLARALDGEDADRPTLLLSTFAVLTKDQSAGGLIAPLLLLPFAPWLAHKVTLRQALLRPSLPRAAALSIALYLLISGAVVNPIGFARRLQFLLGPASHEWFSYDNSWSGRTLLLRDIARKIPALSSWPSAALSAFGVFIAMRSRDARKWIYLLGAISFTVLFNGLALRSEHRFLLLQSVLLAPYACVLIAVVPRVLMASAIAATCILSWRSVLSVDATMIADSRYAMEQKLSELPARSTLEIMGGPKFFPRFAPALLVTRVGSDAFSSRSAIPGVREVLDDPAHLDSRAPDYLLLSVEFATPEFFPKKPGRGAYQNASSIKFFRDLHQGFYHYEPFFDSKCVLPWPLTCVQVHWSTGGRVLLYRKITTR